MPVAVKKKNKKNRKVSKSEKKCIPKEGCEPGSSLGENNAKKITQIFFLSVSILIKIKISSRGKESKKEEEKQ